MEQPIYTAIAHDCLADVSGIRVVNVKESHLRAVRTNFHGHGDARRILGSPGIAPEHEPRPRMVIVRRRLLTTTLGAPDRVNDRGLHSREAFPTTKILFNQNSPCIVGAVRLPLGSFFVSFHDRDSTISQHMTRIARTRETHESIPPCALTWQSTWSGAPERVIASNEYIIAINAPPKSAPSTFDFRHSIIAKASEYLPWRRSRDTKNKGQECRQP